MCRRMIGVTRANWGICVQTVVVWPQKAELCAWPICMRKAQLTVVGASKYVYLSVVWWQGNHWLDSDSHICYGGGCIDGPSWSVFAHCFPGFQHLLLCAGKLIVCSFCTYLVCLQPLSLLLSLSSSSFCWTDRPVRMYLCSSIGVRRSLLLLWLVCIPLVVRRVCSGR